MKMVVFLVRDWWGFIRYVTRSESKALKAAKEGHGSTVSVTTLDTQPLQELVFHSAEDFEEYVKGE